MFSPFFSQLRKRHPDLAVRFPPFPKKKVFGNTDPKFVEQRQSDLAAYLSGILRTFPGLLDDSFLREFLDLDRRVTYVREALAHPGGPEAAAPIQPKLPVAAQFDHSPSSMPPSGAPLTADEMGALEGSVRVLSTTVKAVDYTGVNSPELATMVQSCMDMLPRLRVSAANFDDVEILPRAMQCEEEMDKALSEYKSMLLAASGNVR